MIFNPENRPIKIDIKAGIRVDIDRSIAWDSFTIEHVERRFGVAREHIDAFFQLPVTIEKSDTDRTFWVSQDDMCLLDVFLRHLPKNYPL